MSWRAEDLAGIGRVFCETRKFILTQIKLRLSIGERRLKRESLQRRNEEQALKNEARWLKNEEQEWKNRKLALKHATNVLAVEERFQSNDSRRLPPDDQN